MKLGPLTRFHLAEKANRRISNIEPQNIEGWLRFAQSFYKIVRIHLVPLCGIHLDLVRVYDQTLPGMDMLPQF